MMENSQRVNREVDQDYISALPNSTLCNILSSLSTREAVKTSVLSSRWRHVWTSPNMLVLDAENMLKSEHYSGTSVCNMSEIIRYNFRLNRTKVFVANVNHYLALLSKFQLQKIERLEVRFTFRRGGHGCGDLSQWISFAIGRNVEEIEICLSEKKSNHLSSGGALYVFPCDIVGVGNNEGPNGFIRPSSCLKRMRLAHCVLAPQRAYNHGFTTLTTLDLMRVDLVSGHHIQILLASCHSLEWLSLAECYNMDCLKIEQPFCQRLRYLNVSLCCQLKAIVLKGSNLETLEYRGCTIDFVFDDAPRLRTFFTQMSDCVFNVAIHLPQLETLYVECTCATVARVMNMTNRMPAFPNLRHLIIMKVATFRQDPRWVPSVLKECPTLQILELHLRTIFHFYEELRKPSCPPMWPHHHLKEVKLTGIKGNASEIEMAIYLLRNAIALQKMTIDPRPRIYLGNNQWGLSEACNSWSMVGRQKVYDHLRPFITSGIVDIVIQE